MPIRPEHRHHYGPAWRVQRKRILGRAGDVCECAGECGELHDRCHELPDGTCNGAMVCVYRYAEFGVSFICAPKEKL